MAKCIILLILFISFSFVGCDKKNSENNKNFWKVKYEVSCTNPQTKVIITYRKEDGQAITVGDPIGEYQQLPWSYESNYTKDPGLIIARALVLAVSSAQNFNSTTDRITAKIFVDGILVNQSSEESFFGIMIQYTLN